MRPSGLPTVAGLPRAFADRPFFKEFVLSCPGDVERLLSARGKPVSISALLLRVSADAESGAPQNGILVAVTEQRTRARDRRARRGASADSTVPRR